MLAAIHLGVASPGLFHITTFLLQHVGQVIPALQMPAAELALGVFFVTGALSQLLDFDFMIR